ncbi:MAG: DUF4157 domain-containing protein [Bacteroidetes bacterium]|nr:DUF4157 domain-containing protein [Bacteroidota bacterium]
MFQPKKSSEQAPKPAGMHYAKGFLLADNRPSTIAQRKQLESAQLSKEQPVQNKPNNTGLPDQLKTGIENLSGHSMDDVQVHFNSSQPAQLNAHAYAQGNQIHLAPGQEKHLPHEAWHVVQQKQGRVKPTMQMKGKVNVNDDHGLEKEADVMGRQALQGKQNSSQFKQHEAADSPLHIAQSVQRLSIGSDQHVVQCLLTSATLTNNINGVAGNLHDPHIAAIINALNVFHAQRRPWFYGRQQYSDAVLAALDTMEHQVYAYLVANKAQPGGAGTEKHVIHALLNEIQTAHTDAIEYLHYYNLRLYTPDRAGMTAAQSTRLDQNWNSLRRNTGTVNVDTRARSYGPGTHDQNLPEFARHNRAMFARIMSRPMGRSLINELLDNSDGRNIPIDIRPYHPDLVGMGIMTGAEANNIDANALALGNAKFKRRGTGSGSLIGMESGLTDGANTNTDTAGHQIPSPAFIVVAHELIHALHNKQGNNRRNIAQQRYAAGGVHHGWTNKEEHSTIETGFGVTENKLRLEHGLGTRHGH